MSMHDLVAVVRLVYLNIILLFSRLLIFRCRYCICFQPQFLWTLIYSNIRHLLSWKKTINSFRYDSLSNNVFPIHLAFHISLFHFHSHYFLVPLSPAPGAIVIRCVCWLVHWFVVIS